MAAGCRSHKTDDEIVVIVNLSVAAGKKDQSLADRPFLANLAPHPLLLFCLRPLLMQDVARPSFAFGLVPPHPPSAVHCTLGMHDDDVASPTLSLVMLANVR